MFLYSSLASKAIVKQLSGSSHLSKVTVVESEDRQPGMLAPARNITTRIVRANVRDIISLLGCPEKPH